MSRPRFPGSRRLLLLILVLLGLALARAAEGTPTFQWEDMDPQVTKRLERETLKLCQEIPALGAHVQQVYVSGPEGWYRKDLDGYTHPGGERITYNRRSFWLGEIQNPERLARHELGHVCQWLLGLDKNRKGQPSALRKDGDAWERWAWKFADSASFRAQVKRKLEQRKLTLRQPAQ